MTAKFNPKVMMDHINTGNIEAQKDTALKVLRYVVFRSPVRDGFYKANHILTYKNTTNRTRKTPDKVGNKVMSQGIDALGRINEFGEVIYIQNNLPYAERIEFGHSQQEPSGVYRLAAQAVART